MRGEIWNVGWIGCYADFGVFGFVEHEFCFNLIKELLVKLCKFLQVRFGLIRDMTNCQMEVTITHVINMSNEGEITEHGKSSTEN